MVCRTSDQASGAHGHVSTYRKATETLSHGKQRVVFEPGARERGAV